MPVRECAAKPARGHTSAVRLDLQDPSHPRVSGPRGDLWIVVLAGGNGTRLRSFTQQVLGTERPKQFCRIIGTRSMLRHTWDRALRLVPPERIILGLAEIGMPRVLTHLRSIASCLGTPAEAAALTQVYKLIPSTNLSQVVLPRHPEALLVLAARGISWCDWGDPDRIVHTLRRFNRRPEWLPAYARTQAAMGAGLTRENPHRKENSHATV